MKCTGITISMIALVTLCAFLAPPVVAENSIGIRLGYDVFWGQREDDFIFRSAWNLEYNPDSRDFAFVDDSLPGPQDMDANGLFIGAEGNFTLPGFDNERLIISPVLEYYSKKNINYPIDAASLQFDGVDPNLLTYIQNDLVEYKLLSFMANLKYLLMEGNYHTMVPYVGGGLGLHYYQIDAERVYFGGTVIYDDPDLIPIDTSNYTLSDKGSGWSFGAQILGGTGFDIHPQIEPFVEIGFRFMTESDTRLFNGQLDEEIYTANFNGFQFLGGVRFKF